MGIVERREREKAERKETIMRCAKELILERGVEKVGMMDIAKKAELSKATLYLYFPSKDVLFKEICDVAADRFIRYFHARFDPGLSVVDTIKLIWKSYLDLFGESDDIVVIFSMKQYIAPNFPFVPIEKDSPSPAGSNFAFYSLLVDVFSRGVREGVFSEDVNPAVVSQILLTLFSYFIENTARMPKTQKNYRMAIEELGHLFQIFLRGIAGKNANARDFDLSNLLSEDSKIGARKRS
jgi:AcrR family transcriptional regulator